MMCRVTDADANSSDGSATGRQNEQGVLANLPRTRPQRASQRRTAARRKTARDATRGAAGAQAAATRRPEPSGRVEAAAAAAPAARVDPGRPTAAPSATRRREGDSAERRRAPSRGPSARRKGSGQTSARKSSEDAAPRQGFESEGDFGSGPVQPPGATELVASAAEIVGELAKAGISTGERLLKDVFSRLPLS
jgi:hypothetical protein